MFTIIASWLINAAGRPFEQPQEYDDPNATVSNILSQLRAFVSTTQLTVHVGVPIVVYCFELQTTGGSVYQQPVFVLFSFPLHNVSHDIAVKL